MSTLTSPTSSRQPVFRRRGRSTSQWRRAAAWMLGFQAVLGAWFWLIAVVGVTVAILVIGRIASVEVSIMQFAAQGATWFPFALAVILATTQLGVHVANGMTRRSFTRAALVTCTISAIGYALVMVLAIRAEAALYARTGWPHVVGSDDSAIWENSFGPSLLGYGLVFLGAQVSGLLVGIGYYRFGGWWGTLLLPLTVAPALLLQVAGPLLSGDTWEWGANRFSAPLTVVVPAALAVIAAGALGFHALARTVPIHRVAA